MTESFCLGQLWGLKHKSPSVSLTTGLFESNVDKPSTGVVGNSVVLGGASITAYRKEKTGHVFIRLLPHEKITAIALSAIDEALGTSHEARYVNIESTKTPFSYFSDKIKKEGDTVTFFMSKTEPYYLNTGATVRLKSVSFAEKGDVVYQISVKGKPFEFDLDLTTFVYNMNTIFEIYHSRIVMGDF